MKRLNSILIAIALICIIAMGSASIIYGGQFFGFPSGIKENNGKSVKVYGQKINQEAERVKLVDVTINSYDELVKELSPIRNIKHLDLGDFELTLAQRDSLEQKYPGIKIESKVYTIVWGKKIYTTDRRINFTKSSLGESDDADSSGPREVTLADLKELTDAIPSLPELRIVELGDTKIQADDKKALRERFPDVTFNMISVTSVAGKTFSTDVERIDLSDVKLDVDFYKELSEFTRLEVVDTRNQSFTINEKLEIVKACPNIRFIWGVQLVKGKAANSETASLDLTGIHMKLSDIEKRIPLFPKLQRIDMTDTGYTHEELAEFREKMNSKYGVDIAWTVRMGQWSLKTDQVAFSVLIYTYNYKRLTSSDIQVLKYCNKLQALDLGHQAISDITVIGEYLTDLRILILADNALRDISPIANLKHLHYVELFVNYAIRDMSPLGECKELVDVNIGWTSFSDVSGLLELPLLERLWIINSPISEASRQQLREAYPDAILTFQGKNSLANNWRGHKRYSAMMHGWYSRCITSDFTKFDGLVFKD